MKSSLVLPEASTVAREHLIRLLVADYELIQWSGLHQAFSPGRGFLAFPCEGTFSQILADAISLAPCVVLANYSLVSEVSTGELRDHLRQAPAVNLLVRGTVPRDAEDRLLMEGVVGVIPESFDSALLVRAVRAVHRGEIWAGRLVVARVLRKLQGRLLAKELTDREFEVLELVAGGFSNREIADKLFICRETVRWHIRSLYSKIRVKNRASATKFARESLLIQASVKEPMSSGSSSGSPSRTEDLPMAAG